MLVSGDETGHTAAGIIDRRVGTHVDAQLVRRAAPGVYALAIVICLLFARSALVAVCIVGAMLLGLMYWLLPASPGGRNRPGRDRQRLR